jgi:hypothetical protein
MDSEHPPSLGLYRACFTFTGHPDRGLLGLSKGDLVVVVSRGSDRLWLVRPLRWHHAEQAEGWVPCDYLRRVGAGDPDPSDEMEEARPGEGEPGISGVMYESAGCFVPDQTLVADEDLQADTTVVDTTVVGEDERHLDRTAIPRAKGNARFSIASIQIRVYRNDWRYVQEVDAGSWGTVFQMRTPGQSAAVHAVKVLNSRWRMSRTLAMTVVEEIAILKQRAKRASEGKYSPFLLELADLDDDHPNIWLTPDQRVHILTVSVTIFAILLTHPNDHPSHSLSILVVI